ncbi:MAG: polyphosphate kinase 2 family protein [Chloroflexota bacterium]
MAKQPLHPPVGEPVRLADFDPEHHADYEKSGAKELLRAYQKKTRELQERLYAEGKQSLLVVFQAMDTGGKDSTIRRVFEGVNPAGVQVTGFKRPTSEELAHDFLWRIHQHTPPRGYIGIFNRSHYEDVLVVRVNELVPEAVWRARYDHINQFEKLLVDNGTRVLKFYLHISKDEQKQRLQDRLDDAEKHWKFDIGDLPVRERWDEYMRAFEDTLTHCNTTHAPWYVIPANRKWYRDLAVCRTIAETLEAMDPQYPPPAPGLEDVVIPD